MDAARQRVSRDITELTRGDAWSDGAPPSGWSWLRPRLLLFLAAAPRPRSPLARLGHYGRHGPIRTRAFALLAAASLAVSLGSFIAAWVTLDFWATIPMVSSVLGAGVFAALALYVRRRRLWSPLVLGLAVAFATFVATFFITFARWAE